MIFLLLVLLHQRIHAIDYHCYDFKFKPRVCLPGPENIVLHRTINISPNMSCGEPPSNYCRTAKPSGCYVCNKTNMHPSNFMTDKDYPISYWNIGIKPTWWQSITWWDAKQRNLLKNNTLKVSISVSMNKTYDLSGSMKITFYSSKPQAFIIERSSDFGATWFPYRYFADDCKQKFKNVKLFQDISSYTDVYCEEDKNINAVQGKEVTFQPHYTLDRFWSNTTQNYLRATDLRIALEYPWTDGNEIIDQELFLNKFYYDITDLQIHGRCHCSGHAPYCYGDTMSNQKCACQHFTDGVDCEKCLPLYNNKTWKPAESGSKPNPCEACECNNHSQSCTYNSTLQHGVCDDCLHGTAGYSCERCQQLFFFNVSSVSIKDENACIPCNCYLPGTTGNGSCYLNSSDASKVGQCYCKDSIIGKKCDQCKNGFYGLELGVSGTCFACNCSPYGSINKTTFCNQSNGQCSCKSSTIGRTCSECKPGFFSFPSHNTGECLPCDCDLGGSYDGVCNNMTGDCLCRHGITSKDCRTIMQDVFIPYLDYFSVEAEHKNSEREIIISSKKHFSGAGALFLRSGANLSLLFTPNFTYRYHVTMRHDSNSTTYQELLFKLTYINDTTSYPISETVMRVNKNKTFLTLNSTFFLVQNINYSIEIVNLDNKGVNIDSVVFLPEYKNSKLYQFSNDSQRNQIQQCWKQQQYISQMKFSSICKSIIFSLSAEMFDGALECNCDKNGSMNSSCNAIGGQCICKHGVNGRQCDQCELGYYNLSTQGCKACMCDKVGSQSSVCSTVTGQCYCKTNVTNRACNRCLPDQYGFQTGAGCQPCLCNQYGVLSTQCLDNGTCSCKNTTTGVKCDQCIENHFNFTENGCSACGCNIAGSKTLQCDSKTGLCLCKQNVIGNKCMECRNGFFNMDKSHEFGCKECFCFNKTSSCKSSNQTLTEKAQHNNTPSDFIKIQFTEKQKSVILATSFRGNLLYLHYNNLNLHVLFHLENNTVAANYIKLIITSLDDEKLIFQSQPILTNTNVTVSFNIQQKNLVSKIPVWKLQTILFSVKTFNFVFVGDNADYAILYSGPLNKTIPAGDKLNSYIEECSCPMNYTGFSCDKCAKGYTREMSRSGSFGKCVKCQCSGRSDYCDPETGICLNCRYGTTGNYCEKCSPNVVEPSCNKCETGFFGYNNTLFGGCKACDCIAVNTYTGNETICNVVNGQCPCKPDIGGRICDRCAENAVNISLECKTCSVCHSLIQNEVHMLRISIKQFKTVVVNASNMGSLLVSSNFPNVLQSLTVETTRLVNNAKLSSLKEQRLIKDLLGVNETLDELQKLLQVNISKDVSLVRAKLPLLNSTVNTSSTIIDKIYRLLWTSVYVINNNIEPLNYSISQKVNMLTEMSKNISSIVRSYESRYAPVLRNMALLLNTTSQLMNQSRNANNQSKYIAGVLDKTSKDLKDISNAVKGTETLMGKLHKDAEVFMNRTNVLLKDLNTTYRLAKENDTRFFDNSTTLKNEIKLLREKLQSINTSSENAATTLRNISFAAKQFLNISATERSSLNKKLLLNNNNYKALQLARSNVSVSLRKISDINSTANRMVDLLTDFKSTSVNASMYSKEALSIIKMMNSSSLSSLKYLTSAKEVVESIKVNASLLFNISNAVYNESYLSNKVLDDLTVHMYRLLNASKLLLGTVSKQYNITQNITSLSKTLRQQKLYCQMITPNLTETSHSLKSLKKNASEAASKETVQNTRLKELIADINNASVLNVTKLNELKTSLNASRVLFDTLNMKHMLTGLKSSRDSQAGYISEYRLQVNAMKEEVSMMKALYQSVSSKKGCT